MKFIEFPDLIRRYFSGEPFVIFDTETTGLNTYHDDIVEIAGARWQRGQSPQFFHELIRSSPHKMTPVAWELHKIPLDQIAAARPPELVLKDFMEFCGSSVLLAHNAKFDFEILNYNLIRNNLRPYQQDQIVCTLRFAQQKTLPGKLSALASHCKVTVQSAELHRALYDVQLLLGIMNHMMTLHEPKELQYSLIL